MVTSFKRSHAGTAAVSAPDPAAGHRRPTPPLETPGHSWASLGQSLVGSLLLSLGPGVHKVLFVPSKSLFTQSCVSSDGSLVGLMATSSKRAYAIPRSPAPRTLPLQQSTVDPYLHRRESITVLAQSLWFGHAFCALSRLSSSGDQVLAEHTVPGGLCVLITSPVLAGWCPGCAARVPSQVCHVRGVSPLGS